MIQRVNPVSPHYPRMPRYPVFFSGADINRVDFFQKTGILERGLGLVVLAVSAVFFGTERVKGAGSLLAG